MADPAHPVTQGTVGRPGSGSIISAAEFSADGNLLATGWDVNDLRLWDVSDARHPVGGHIFHYGDYFAFSPTTSLLVLGSLVGTEVRLWDVRDAGNPVRVGELTNSTTDLLTDMAFSPDGRTVAVGYQTATVLWDITDPDDPNELSTLTGYATGQSVEFGPNGRTLATGELLPVENDVTKGTTHLWDISDPHHPAAFATIDSGAAMSFASPGELVVAGYQATVDVWPSTPRSAVRRACAFIGESITSAQWQRYLPDQPYHPPCR
jgi:WD40 repeat protein